MEDQKVINLLQTLVDGINKRFDGFNERFDKLEQRFDKLEERNKLEHQQLMQAIMEVDNTKFEIRRIK